MAEQVQDSQKTLVIGLAIISALLAVIVGIVIYQQGQNKTIPSPAAQATMGATAAQPAQTPAGMGQATTAAFDEKTATKVPKGIEPEAFVKAYYVACDKGDWKAAFEALPAVKKAGSSPEALEQQVSGYGIKSFKITAATIEGDRATVKVDQETGQYGTFENTWTFVKAKDGTWLVESKAVTGMK